MSSGFTATPAGKPSTIAVRAGPWDSPAVKKRSMFGFLADEERMLYQRGAAGLDGDP